MGVLEEYAEKDLRIRLISRKNKSLVEALTKGVGLANAPLIASRMGAGDIVLPIRLQEQLIV